jgi:hypothetical protein
VKITHWLKKAIKEQSKCNMIGIEELRKDQKEYANAYSTLGADLSYISGMLQSGHHQSGQNDDDEQQSLS